MIDSAKRLYGERCKPDLVTRDVTVFSVEKRLVFLLDIISIRDRGGSADRWQRLELGICRALGERLLGCALGRVTLRGLSVATNDVNALEARQQIMTPSLRRLMRDQVALHDQLQCTITFHIDGVSLVALDGREDRDHGTAVRFVFVYDVADSKFGHRMCHLKEQGFR